MTDTKFVNLDLIKPFFIETKVNNNPSKFVSRDTQFVIQQVADDAFAFTINQESARFQRTLEEKMLLVHDPETLLTEKAVVQLIDYLNIEPYITTEGYKALKNEE